MEWRRPPWQPVVKEDDDLDKSSLYGDNSKEQNVQTDGKFDNKVWMIEHFAETERSSAEFGRKNLCLCWSFDLDHGHDSQTVLDCCNSWVLQWNPWMSAML